MDQEQNQGNQGPKQQVAEKIRASTNVLVTVRSNPSVDELAAAIGLTLMLNKLDKHATAVFSGNIPSTLEFLKPEETIETNTDSLRDFIVSLDKAKADKLRYKVEENVVKIFITPYRTSITQDDLEFTQGDFNVDVVLALGVTQREELDQAITAHGRILHDATVVTVTAGQKESDLGNINWQDSAASSLSEMLVSISEALQGGLIDSQIATAFLTGIVAETERFSNSKTSPKVMTMSAQLMAAGANQQLIANELQKDMLPAPAPIQGAEQDNEHQAEEVGEDGSLSIEHDTNHTADQNEENQEDSNVDPRKTFDHKLEGPERNINGHSAYVAPLSPEESNNLGNPLFSTEQPPAAPTEKGFDGDGGTFAGQGSLELPGVQSVLTPDMSPPPPQNDDIHIDPQGNLLSKPNVEAHHAKIMPLQTGERAEKPEDHGESFLGEGAQDEEMFNPMAPPEPEDPRQTDPPTEASKKTFEHKAPGQSTQPESQPASEAQSAAAQAVPATPPPPIPTENTTLEQIEESVHSPHVQEPVQPSVSPATELHAQDNLDSARQAVNQVYGQSDFDPAGHAQQNIGAMPLGGELHPSAQQPAPQQPSSLPQAVQPNQQPPVDEPSPPPVPPPFTG